MDNSISYPQGVWITRNRKLNPTLQFCGIGSVVVADDGMTYIGFWFDPMVVSYPHIPTFYYGYYLENYDWWIIQQAYVINVGSDCRKG